MAVQKNFVIKNGLEVDNNLIFANADLNRVGISTNNPQHTFDVIGGIGASTLTVRDELILEGTVSVGSSIGDVGQYLISTGEGVAWQSLPNSRKIYTEIADVGIKTFSSFTYIPGLLDVFINGVKLKGDGTSPEHEFTATTGNSVILDDPCFGGETVEFVVYSSYSVAGTVGIQENVYTTGIVTSLGGFISVGNTTPIQIKLSGNILTFTAVGIGSTSFTLS